MTMITLQFDDFKTLADNHRVYYFVGDGYYDFIYLVDGVIVKTTVMESDIDNTKQFFSDKLFYGAVQLTFPIENKSLDLFSKTYGTRKELDEPIFDVQVVQDDEVKNDDIQRDGVQIESNN